MPMTKKPTKTNKVNEKKGGRGIIVAFLLVVIVALVGVIVVLATNVNKSNNTTEETKRNVVVNEKNVDEVVSKLVENKRTPVGSYEVTMNTTWNFNNGKSASGNAYVKNATSNTNSVYFDVKLSNTEEVILSSPILPVGTYMESITLDKELPAGEYDCVCTYNLLDENDKPVSKVNVGLKIVIKN